MKANAQNLAKVRPVEIEGLGTFYVRPVTVGEADKQRIGDQKERADIEQYARTAAKILCDQDGVRTFDPDNEEDIALIQSQGFSQILDLAVKSQDGKQEGN